MLDLYIHNIIYSQKTNKTSSDRTGFPTLRLLSPFADIDKTVLLNTCTNVEAAYKLTINRFQLWAGPLQNTVLLENPKRK